MEQKEGERGFHEQTSVKKNDILFYCFQYLFIIPYPGSLNDLLTLVMNQPPLFNTVPENLGFFSFWFAWSMEKDFGSLSATVLINAHFLPINQCPSFFHTSLSFLFFNFVGPK